MKSDKNNIMIRYAQSADKDKLYVLWKNCFHDSDAFMDYYFDYFFRNNQVLMLEQAGALKSMIHLNPYQISVNGTTVDSYYIVGVATDAGFRHRGAMTQLLQKVFDDCGKANMPFVYLMPADEAIYRPFQFAYIYQQYVEKKCRYCPESVDVSGHLLKEVMESRITAKPIISRDEHEALASLANQLLSETKAAFARRDGFYYERLQMENQADGGDLFALFAGDKWIGYVSLACEEALEVREIYCLPEWKASAAQWLMQTYDGKKGELLPLLSEPFMPDVFCSKAQMRPIIMGRIICLKQWITLMPLTETTFDIRMKVVDDWIPENNGIWHWQYNGDSMIFEADGQKDGMCDFELGIDTLMQWLAGYCPIQELVQKHRVKYRETLSEQQALDILQKMPVLHGWMINEIV